MLYWKSLWNQPIKPIPQTPILTTQQSQAVFTLTFTLPNEDEIHFNVPT